MAVKGWVPAGQDLRAHEGLGPQSLYEGSAHTRNDRNPTMYEKCAVR